MARSWLSIRLERSGTGITADEYKNLEKSSMCGVRAISSVVGVEPQFDDKIVRMKQFQKKILSNNALGEDLSLPGKLAEIDSPLGRAVKQHSVEHKKLNYSGIQREFSSGAQVVLLGRCQVLDEEKPKRHEMHVRPIGDGMVESLSDDGFVFEINDNIDALVFRKNK